MILPPGGFALSQVIMGGGLGDGKEGKKPQCFGLSVFAKIKYLASKLRRDCEEANADHPARTIPQALRRKYEQLVAKRQAETLTPSEHHELLRLTDRVEKVQDYPVVRSRPGA
jgi:hypothetical protein